MKILLTGGTGFLGKYVVRKILSDGKNEIIGLAIDNPEYSHERIKWIKKGLVDITEKEMDGVDVLVHLAAYGVNPAFSDWEKCFQVNVADSISLLLKADKAGIHNFLISGSCFEYGRSGERFEFIPNDAPLEPTRPYEISKAAFSVVSQGFARNKNWNLTITRLFHIFGEGEAEQRFWPSLKKAAVLGHDFKMTKGELVRDFTPVEFAAERIYGEIKALMDSQRVPGPITKNIGTGHPQSLREFAEYWWKKWNAKGTLLFGEVDYRENEVFRFVPKVDR